MKLTSPIFARKCQVPELRIPPRIRSARTSQIEVAKVAAYPTRLEFDWAADFEWISCGYALPHRDDHLEDFHFLTLAVRSAHRIGTEDSGEIDCPLSRGDLFFIDPMKLHWLFPGSMYPDRKRARVSTFVGLQWIVVRKKSKRAAQELIDALTCAIDEEIE